MPEPTERAATTAGPRPGEVHRCVVEMYDDGMVRGRFDEALALIAPDVVDHRGGAGGDHHGRDAWRQKWERAAAGGDGFSDVSATIECNVAAGDVSVNRYTIRGTHVSTGRRYEVTGMDMVRVRDGRIVEHWAVLDTDAIRQQLGG